MALGFAPTIETVGDFEMSEDEDCAWISLECATRNVVALLQGPNGSSGKKNGASSAPVSSGSGGMMGGAAGLERLPAALTWEGAGVAAGLPQGEDVDPCGGGLVKRA